MKKWLAFLLAMMLLFPSAALAEERFQDHILLQQMGRSSCRTLTGDITLYVIFAETPNAPWDHSAQSTALETLDQACLLLEQAAAAYGKRLDLAYSCHTAPSLPETDEENLGVWLDLALKKADLPATGAASPYVQQHSPILVLFNKAGRNFAMANGEDNFCEFLFLHKDFVESSVMHELMHLYGARDFYYHQTYQEAAENIFHESIMLSYNNTTIDSLTAYCIGWTDSLDDSAVRFLESTAHVTEEDFNAALEEASFTGHATQEYTQYTYTGDWVMGQWQGEGVQQWHSGARYEGEFVQGKRHGQGVLRFSDGEIYKGQFAANNQQGYGVMIWNDLGLYAGNWETGEAIGPGTCITSDGTILSGSMEGYSLQGQGIQIWPDGSVYKGDFVDGQRTGKGVFIWADGSIYTGEFVDGALNGYGVYISADGYKMEGQWVNNALQP
ncbi:MAG: hypothetical protein E7324_02465 [Clostridiales bacterium]|nr:hypothetical protein [Clostridiales bacterium]